MAGLVLTRQPDEVVVLRNETTGGFLRVRMVRAKFGTCRLTFEGEDTGLAKSTLDTGETMRLYLGDEEIKVSVEVADYDEASLRFRAPDRIQIYREELKEKT